MSVLVYGPNQVKLVFAGGNYFLAHLQAATHRRFAGGRGYFLTVAGDGDDGRDSCVAYWMHPGIALLFSYDTENDEGEPPGTIDVKGEDVEALIAVMDRPIGVLSGFSVERGRYLPFMHDEPSADTEA